MPPKTIYLIRHGEKPSDPSNKNLSSRGHERAEALAAKHGKLFGPFDYLFAARESSSSNRPLETITPLATVLGLDIDDSIEAKDYSDLTDRLLEDNRYERQSVLICWHHEDIPSMAKALRAKHAPSEWPGSVFDRNGILDQDIWPRHCPAIGLTRDDFPWHLRFCLLLASAWPAILKVSARS
jgi:broad specificity phosphatase PhoE